MLDERELNDERNEVVSTTTTSETSRTQRIVVPLRDERCSERLVQWLQTCVDSESCELMLVHVIEPEWSADIPESGLQALNMIVADTTSQCAKEWLLNQIAMRIQMCFPKMRVSWQVRYGLTAAAQILALAEVWKAHSIVIFVDRRPFWTFGSRIANYLIRRSNRRVQIVHESEPNQFTTPVLT